MRDYPLKTTFGVKVNYLKRSENMANIAKQQELNQVKSYLMSNSVQKRLKDMLDNRASYFTNSIINLVSSNPKLLECTPESIMKSAMTGASLNLSIDPNLGESAIIPYGKKATWQIMYKGLVQLALRTGKYLKLNTVEVYENQFKAFNRLTEELDADFSIEGEGAVIGYAGYFKLVNGFEKTVYWTKDEIQKHADRYSQSYKRDKQYKKNDSMWTTDFDAMAKKTVLKLMIDKWGVKSIDMQKAVQLDHSTGDEQNPEYPDNPKDEFSEFEELDNPDFLDDDIGDTPFAEDDEE